MRFIYLKKNIPVGTCIGSIIFERVIDLFWLLFFAVLGLFFFQIQYLFYVSICCSFLLIFILIALFNNKVFSQIKLLFFKYVKSEKIKKFICDFEKFNEIFVKSKKKVILFLCISFQNWLISIIQSYLIFYFINVDINILHVFARLPLGVLLTLIPISIGGIGAREASFLFLFHNLVIPEKIIAFSVLFYLFRYVLPGLFGLPFIFFIKRKSNNK